MNTLRSGRTWKTVGLTFSLITAACGVPESGTEIGSGHGELDRNPPLADLDVLLADEPKADEIPRMDFKADGPLAAQHSDLREFMSPVKSQGSRGVCSIFSTAGLMEHLYLVEGTMENPDFSEQYLQWSAKFQVKSFQSTSGSNAYYNLRSITGFGIVQEHIWPYETRQWGVDEDEECTGEDDQPTRCYTNGHPSDAIKSAQKFKLPRNRSLHPLDIKNHIASNGTAVVAGFTFFYQAWNHRLSELPTSEENWAKGIVLYPNETDVEKSLEKRAGHSILLIGWDDDMEVPLRDENGEILLDDAGEPVVEKGFYLFKNSWGTSSFGIDNEFGPGYGWISQRYMREYARPRVSAPPKNVVLPVEICGDELDNDGNGAADCDDAACSANIECGSDVLTFTGGGVEIPDNDEAGVVSEIVIEETGTVGTLTVELDITHTYRGDLLVMLTNGENFVVLHDQEGGSQNDLVATYEVTEFAGAELSGTWALQVSDNAAIDTGALNSWSLTATVAGGEEE